MGKKRRNSDGPALRPVKKIELSEKNVALRLFLVIVLIVIAASAFAYGFQGLFSQEAGYQEVTVDAGAEANCGSEFVLMYHLGMNGTSATAENKALTLIYTDAVEKAYQLFHNSMEFEGVNNVAYINAHPNEVIKVDEVLYNAFSTLQKYENRYIYLAPIYRQYSDIFYCSDDSAIVDFDPYSNPEIATYYREIAKFACDSNAVNLELIGDNKVQLCVSEEYFSYAEENGITDFINFSWMKNAFIIDYFADVMIEKGYQSGTISSYDGFSRNLDESGAEYAFNIFDKRKQNVYTAGVMKYTGMNSIVFLRNYPMHSIDGGHYYELDNGDIRTSYLDIADGYCKSAVNNLVSYSADLGCAEVLMQMMPIYIADTFDAQALLSLMENGIHSIYCENGVIYYNEKSLVLTELYQKEDVQYQTSFVEK